MNIFYLDRNPIIAAQSMCDKHVVKMILESVQMLCYNHRILDGVQYLNENNKISYKLDNYDDIILKTSGGHLYHPSTLWVRESSSNYIWLYNHFIALCEEYTYRYNRVHVYYERFKDILNSPPKNIPVGRLTKIKYAFGEQKLLRTVIEPVVAYRLYYISKKNKFKMVWKKRDVPLWFKNENYYKTKYLNLITI